MSMNVPSAQNDPQTDLWLPGCTSSSYRDRVCKPNEANKCTGGGKQSVDTRLPETSTAQNVTRKSACTHTHTHTHTHLWFLFAFDDAAALRVLDVVLRLRKQQLLGRRFQVLLASVLQGEEASSSSRNGNKRKLESRQNKQTNKQTNKKQQQESSVVCCH